MGDTGYVDVTIHVLDVNEPPVLVCPVEFSVDEGKSVTFTATATDPDLPAQQLTFSLAGDVPAGASIDPNSGTFTWNTDEQDGSAEYTFEVRVTDQSGLSDARRRDHPHIRSEHPPTSSIRSAM